MTTSGVVGLSSIVLIMTLLVQSMLNQCEMHDTDFAPHVIGIITESAWLPWPITARADTRLALIPQTLIEHLIHKDWTFLETHFLCYETTEIICERPSLGSSLDPGEGNLYIECHVWTVYSTQSRQSTSVCNATQVLRAGTHQHIQSFSPLQTGLRSIVTFHLPVITPWLSASELNLSFWPLTCNQHQWSQSKDGHSIHIGHQILAPAMSLESGILPHRPQAS